MASPSGPQMNCSRRGDRQPGIRLTGVRRAPIAPRLRRGGRRRFAAGARGLTPRWAARDRPLPIKDLRRMPGAGTDKTKRWIEQPGPCVILVEPQLADNIGSAARAMANFGLSRAASGQAARRLAGRARLRDGVRRGPRARRREAVRHGRGGDRRLNYVFATTARAHDQAKPVVGRRGGGAHLRPRRSRPARASA